MLGDGLVIIVIALIVFGPMILKARKKSDERLNVEARLTFAECNTLHSLTRTHAF